VLVLHQYLIRRASDAELATAQAILAERAATANTSGLSPEDERRAQGLPPSGFGFEGEAHLRRRLEEYEGAAGGPAAFAALLGQAPGWAWRDLTLLQLLQAA
jgi:hypothetical protein